LHELTEAKNQLEANYQKLLEESMCAKDLASAAGVKLKALSGEVTKLTARNERLASELASAKNSAQLGASNGSKVATCSKWHDSAIKRDIHASYWREQALEVMLMEKDQREVELQKKLKESKQKESFLEGEIANMWILVGNLKKAQGIDQDVISMPNLIDHDTG
jgi:centromeric protein E